jgi:hypothetical protein
VEFLSVEDHVTPVIEQPLQQRLEERGWRFRQDDDGTFYGECESQELKTFRWYFTDLAVAVAAAQGLQEIRDERRQANSLVQSSQLSLFDYSEFDDDARTVLQNKAQNIRANALSIKRQTLVIAQELLEARPLVPDRQWGRWVESETGFSRDTADKLIQTAEAVASMPQLAANFDAFDKSAVYLLVAPSTPEAAKVEATARAEAGEKITPTKAKEIIERHKPAKPAKEYERGVCRTCGCRDGNRCVAIEGGEICTWAAGEQKTLCNFCRDKRQARRDQAEAAEPVVVKESEILPAENQTAEVMKCEHDVPVEFCNLGCRKIQRYQEYLRRFGQAEAPALDEATAGAEIVKSEADKQREAWESSTIEISIRLHKVDGHENGRLVQVGVGANGEIPKLVFPRFNEVFDLGLATDEQFVEIQFFPDFVANLLLELREALPLKLAQAEARKQAESEKAKAAAAKAVKKPATTKPAATTTATKAKTNTKTTNKNNKKAATK